jgi:hypothetical protein
VWKFPFGCRLLILTSFKNPFKENHLRGDPTGTIFTVEYPNANEDPSGNIKYGALERISSCHTDHTLGSYAQTPLMTTELFTGP